MLLKAAFIFILYLIEVTWALECFDCSRTFPFPSTPAIDTNGCDLTSKDQYKSCSQFLHIRYSEKNANILFEPSPNEILELSNAPQVMTNKTMIWLNDYQFERTFQIHCFDPNACTTDSINRTYANGKLPVLGKYSLNSTNNYRIYIAGSEFANDQKIDYSDITFYFFPFA